MNKDKWDKNYKCIFEQVKKRHNMDSQKASWIKRRRKENRRLGADVE